MTLHIIPRTEARALNLLRFGPIQRRPRGWRFGTAVITDHVVARMLASGQVAIEGDVLRLTEAAPIGAG